MSRRPIGVDELERRYENGLDLWTGRPLEGTERRLWLMSREDGEGRGGTPAVVASLEEVRPGVWSVSLLEAEGLPPASFRVRTGRLRSWKRLASLRPGDAVKYLVPSEKEYDGPHLFVTLRRTTRG